MSLHPPVSAAQIHIAAFLSSWQVVAGGEVNSGRESGSQGGVVDGWSSHVDGDNVGFAPIVAEAAGSCRRGRQCWCLRATATAAMYKAGGLQEATISWWSAECLIVKQA